MLGDYCGSDESMEYCRTEHSVLNNHMGIHGDFSLENHLMLICLTASLGLIKPLDLANNLFSCFKFRQNISSSNNNNRLFNGRWKENESVIELITSNSVNFANRRHIYTLVNEKKNSKFILKFTCF